MKKIFEVAKWEFLERVKTKAFLVSLILTPTLIIGFALAPTLLTNKEQSSPKIIGIVDTSGIYEKEMSQEVENYKLPDGQPRYILINLFSKDERFNKYIADSDVISGKVEGYLLILNGGTDSVKVEYRSKSSGNFDDISKLEESFNNVRIEQKLEEENINSKLINFISKKIDIKPIKIEAPGKESKADFLTTFFVSFILIMLLFIMITLSGQMFVRSLVEEKSSRLIEILISSCSTDELLAGKILGLSALGLFQTAIWVLAALSLFGAAVIPPSAFNNALPMLFYFLSGFVFFTGIFVGVGSIVSTEQEAQQITSYLSLLLLLPVVLAVPAIENPNTILIKILSFIPFTLPTAMVLRLSISDVPAIIIAITFLIMIISIYLSIKISSKVFRIGILSYGKRPSLREIFQWIKEKN